jgi:hypothetical protein
MKVTKHVIWAAAVIGAALVGWLDRGEPAPTARPLVSAQLRAETPRAALPETPVSTPDRIPDEIELPAARRAAGWGELLRESDDYLAFAAKAREAAVRGDAAAKWYLGLAINECTFIFDRVFLKDSPDGSVGYRSIDEARDFIATNMVWPLISTDEELTLLMKRCQGLSEAPPGSFGYGTDWTMDAAESGFPLAQAMAAQTKAQMARYDGSESTRVFTRAEARDLAIEALRTKDPEVILEIGEVAAALAGTSEAEVNKRRLPWLLAACLRSPDCDSLSEPMKLRCKFDPLCQPYETPLDILRRDAGNDFDEVERRARELNEKIDAGMIEESDI